MLSKTGPRASRSKKPSEKPREDTEMGEPTLNERREIVVTHTVGKL